MRAAALLAAIGAAGLVAKSWKGPAAFWVRDSFAGVLYVAFWIVLARMALPRARLHRIVLAVLTTTCVLESLQLWKPPLLEAIRATWIGKALIGTTFSWLDFPHYILGALLGAFLARRAFDRAPRKLKGAS